MRPGSHGRSLLFSPSSSSSSSSSSSHAASQGSNQGSVDFCYIGLDRNGYKDVLGIRCRFARYVEAFPCKTTTKRISPYRPQSNPMERSNKDILRHLRALCTCRPIVLDEWSSYLPIMLSIISNTFTAVTHTTPSRMLYGDCANRLRGILQPFGPKVRAEIGPGFVRKASEAHAFITAAAEDFHQQRIKTAFPISINPRIFSHTQAKRHTVPHSLCPAATRHSKN